MTEQVEEAKVHLTVMLPKKIHAAFRKRCFELGTSMRGRVVKLVEADC